MSSILVEAPVVNYNISAVEVNIIINNRNTNNSYVPWQDRPNNSISSPPKKKKIENGNLQKDKYRTTVVGKLITAQKRKYFIPSPEAVLFSSCENSNSNQETTPTSERGRKRKQKKRKRRIGDVDRRRRRLSGRLVLDRTVKSEI